MIEPSSKVDKAVMEKASKLGEINIRFYRVDVKEEGGKTEGFFGLNEDNRKIPEKVLKGKAISHKAGFVFYTRLYGCFEAN